ncbi:MAG TPA: SAM-dependent methyltransferase [Cyanobacteria bacterium UBA8803]|nr:SAM-dependent methyltransferase [Cyanobacteria bacterium UBA9273]HBL60376.1 SAM-dependent methyltransferase [Cyanobacteria bacterium UBA8803]
MSEIDNSLSRIPLVMAAKRAIEMERSDRLFEDYFAVQLADSELTALIEKWQKQGGDIARCKALRTRFVAVRTRFFDDFLLSVVAQLRQVVILGAGMDTRAFRLPWPSATHLYEVDRPEVLERKNLVLKDSTPQCYREAIAADLGQPWSHLLINKGYKPDLPTVWLMEGLLMYLNKPEVNDLLKTISDLSVPGSYLGADLVSVKSLEVALKSNGLIRQHWRFGTDEPEKLFSIHGWQASVLQPGDEGANFGRYTKKLPSLEVPGLRRSFFVTARNW